MTWSSGRHFLQLPGPTNVPLPVLAAIAQPTIDHRSAEFAALGRSVLERVKPIFRTTQPVIIYPASGTGAWEAALANTLSPGDTVLMFETGWFATLWSRMAARLGLTVELIRGDWRSPVDARLIAEQLANDTQHRIKAVCVVHNETSTGVTSDIPAVRHALDDAGHPALLLVDVISSLGSIDYRHDEWGVDVTVGGSQKGLLLPPGLSFNAISEKALTASRTAAMPRSYWDWGEMLAMNQRGFFPYTPATNLLQGLRVAIDLLQAEGLDTVFARHSRAAEATRRAVRHWGFETQCADDTAHSAALTAVVMPSGFSADAVRAQVLAAGNMSLGSGLGLLDDRVFRIGHLGDFNDPMLIGTLGTIEGAFRSLGIPFSPGGVDAAIAWLSSHTMTNS